MNRFLLPGLFCLVISHQTFAETTVAFNKLFGGPGVDQVNGSAVDSQGNIYITGRTDGGLPVVNAFQTTYGKNGDAFVGKYDRDGTLLWLGYLGGSKFDEGKAIALDAEENPIIAGQTLSLDFPLVDPFQPVFGGGSVTGDAFITIIKKDGSGILASSYMGGDGDDVANGVDFGGPGEILMGGTTSSPNFPTTPGVIQRSGGTLLWMSKDGGESWESSNIGAGGSAAYSLAQDPLNADIFYLGTTAGVYKSSDHAEHWSKAGSGLPANSVLSLAIDPNDVMSVFAGTTSAGAWHTSDGGQTWQKIAALSGSQFRGFTFDPNQSSSLFVGGSGAVWKSEDSGVTWNAARSGLVGSVTSIQVQPGNANNVLAGSIGHTFQSTDGGKTFTDFGSGLPILATPYDILTDPQDPNRIWSGIDSSFGGGVFTTTWGGTQWIPKNTGISIGSVRSYAMDKLDPIIMFAGTFGYGLYKSTDAGEHWTKTQLDTGYYNDLLIDRSDSKRILAASNSQDDAFAAKISGNGRSLLASTYLGGRETDQGKSVCFSPGPEFWATVLGSTTSPDLSAAANAFQKTYGGNTDGFIARLSPDLTQLNYLSYVGGSLKDEVRAGVYDPAGNLFVTGVTASPDFPVNNSPFSWCTGCDSDIGTDIFLFKLERDAKRKFSGLFGAHGSSEANSIALGPNNGIFIGGNSSAPDFLLKNPADKFMGGIGQFSGETYSPFNIGLQGRTFYHLRRDPVDRSFWAAGSGGLFKSTDEAKTWQKKNAPAGLAYFMSMASLQDHNVIFAGASGGLFRSDNGGDTWIQSDEQMGSVDVYTMIELDNSYLAGTSAGLYESNDGKKWTGLEVTVPVRSLLAPAPGLRLAGTQNGVFVSKDKGPWTRGTGLPNRTVFSLAQSEKTFFAATASSQFNVDGGVFQSTDGFSWSPVLRTAYDVSSVAVDPADPLSISIGTVSSSGKGVLRSTDGGATWNSIGMQKVSVPFLLSDGPGKLFVLTDEATDGLLLGISGDGQQINFASYSGTPGEDTINSVAFFGPDRLFFGGSSHAAPLPKSAGTDPAVDDAGIQLGAILTGFTPEFLVQFFRMGDSLIVTAPSNTEFTQKSKVDDPWQKAPQVPLENGNGTHSITVPVPINGVPCVGPDGICMGFTGAWVKTN
jgi:photosystem II stability/assembly factor-like uncharacterized protein